MSDSRRTAEENHFSAMHAALRSLPRQERELRVRAPGNTALPAADRQRDTSGASANPAKKIGHTVVPPRHDLVCYECDYEFSLTGRMRDTVCPRCHNLLEERHHTIGGPCTEPVKSIGTITVKKDATISGTTVRGRDIVLDGIVENATVHAFRKMTIGKNAKVDVDTLRFKDIEVRARARCTFKKKIACRSLVVAGSVRGKLYVEESVTIRSGGIVRGEVHCPSLVIEAGGGIKAKLLIGTHEE